MGRVALLVALLALLWHGLLAGSTAWAAPLPTRTTSAADSTRLPPVRASVLTMGPGDHPFASFGHTALLLEWPGKTRVYNFGTFEFDGLRGVQDFLAGRFRYWLSVSSLPATLAHYGAEGRTLIAQDLNLTRDELARLAQNLEENALPERRFYDYDYFKDNCTTRVRDALDSVLGGALRAALPGPGQLTYRDHTERLTADKLGLSLALDTVLGRSTDRVPDRFGELWVPDTFSEALDSIELDRAGRKEPLVRRTRVLLRADRSPPLKAPPARVPWFALAGLLTGTTMFLLGVLGARGVRGARTLYALLACLFGACAGLLGVVLLGFFLTKHWAAHENYNVLLFGPWALPWVAVARGIARGDASSLDRARRLALLCAGAALLGGVLPLLLGADQDNLRLAAFVLPLWAGVTAGTFALAQTRSRAATNPAHPVAADPHPAHPGPTDPDPTDPDPADLDPAGPHPADPDPADPARPR